ncbi:MAG: CAP domain-containing protein [Gaiellaceae bacterium]|jgi:uncharacterized protein YkwD
MTPRLRAAAVFFAALSACACAAAAGAAVVPPLPPLPEPVGSLLGSSQPAQSAPQSSAKGARTATTTSASAALERLVIAQINVVRREHRLPRLTVSRQLARAGREHARQLAVAGHFSHNWSDGAPFGAWIRRFYPVGAAHRWNAGENLAWAPPELTAQQAVEMWLASPEHRRIMLTKSWRQIGLGAVRADNAGGVYNGQSVVILAAEFGTRG